MQFKRTSALALIALVVMSVFAAAPVTAAAADSFATTVGDNTTNAETTYSHEIELDADEVEDIVLTYPDEYNVSTVDTGNVSVSAGGSSQSVSTASVSGNDVSITLGSAYTATDGDMLTVDVPNVTNAELAGAYDITMDVQNTNDTSISNVPQTNTQVVTGTPAVTESSGLQDNTTVEFNPSEGDNTENVTVNAFTSNFEVEFTDERTNETVDTIQFDSATDAHSIVTAADESNATVGEYQMNVSHSQFSPLERQAGENISVSVDVVNLDNTNVSANEFGVTLASTMTDSVMVIDGQDDSAVTYEQQNASLFGILGSDKEQYVISDNRTVDGDNTTITAYLEGGSASAYADAVNAEDGDALFSVGTLAGDSPVWVFYNEANNDTVDTSSDTYMVYDEGSDALNLHLGDDYADTSSVSFTTVNAQPGVFEGVGLMSLYNTFGLMNALGAWSLTGGSVAAAGILFVFGRRKRSDGE